jgi:MFS transporter, putative metabolite:H+ symporter
MTTATPRVVESPRIGTTSSRAADEIVARLERLPFSPFHVRLASMLGVGTFFDAYDSLVISVALTVVFTSLHISFVNAGLLIGAAYIGQFVGAILFGYLGERLGRKPAFVLALALFGLLSLVTAVTWDFQSLLIARIVQGVGLGAEVPLAAALFNEYIRGKNRGTVGMLYQSLFFWGLFLAPLVGLGLISTLGPDLGWRAAFVVGAIPLLVAIVAHFRLPESARWLAEHGRAAEADRIVSGIEAEAKARNVRLDAPEARYRADVQPTRFGELFSRQYRGRTFMNWTLWFASYFLQAGYTVWLPTLYVQIGGLPPDRALALTLVSSATAVVSAYLAAYAMDHLGRRPLFLFGYAVAMFGAAVGVCAVTILHQTGWPTLFAAGWLMTFGISFTTGSLFIYTAELSPTRMRAWATATGSSVNRMVGFIAPTIVGTLLATELGIGGVFGLLLITSLIGFVTMKFFGIETRQRVLEELSA